MDKFILLGLYGVVVLAVVLIVRAYQKDYELRGEQTWANLAFTTMLMVGAIVVLLEIVYLMPIGGK
jgi:uncharacterized membrane protein